MNKIILIFSLWLVFLPKKVSSQINTGFQTQFHTKINVDLISLWLQTDELSKPNLEVSAMVKGDLSTIKTLTQANKGVYKYGLKNIAAVKFPLSALPALLENPRIERVESQRVRGHTLTFPDDTMLIFHNGVKGAHEGWGNLPRGYEGEGVLLGVIDDGFDWRHPDFQNADSSTRVAYLWDQTLNQPNYEEQVLGYGSEWNSAEINAGYCRQVPMTHGCHVAGIAGGNGRAADKFKGVAAKSELLWVKISESGNDFMANFVDAVYWLKLKSIQLGKPCAINSSVGTYFGSHDGQDLHAAMIDNILSSQNGLLLAQAGGNARQFNFHLQRNAQDAVSNTFFKYEPYAGLWRWVLYADTADFNNLDFNLSFIDSSNLNVKVQSQNYNLKRDFNLNTAWGDTLTAVVYNFNNPNNSLLLWVTAALSQGVYEILFEMRGGLSGDYCRFQTIGAGSFDVWSSVAQIGTSDMVFYPNNSPANYQNPDNKQSIVSSWACSDRVILVSSYQNQTFMRNYARDSVYLGTTGYPQAGISPFSSLGPTRDGRIKPDICASGGQVLSAAPVGNLVSYRNSNYYFLDSAGWHVSNRGTSMSAPIVAGALALYLECNPNANYADAKNILLHTAKLDSFVFKESPLLPNVHWGWGKLDVYNLLNACMVGGCVDSLAANYNPLATYDNGTCLYIPVAAQNISEKLIFYPNPVENYLYWDIPADYLGKELVLYNVLGQQIKTITLTDTRGAVFLGDLRAGFYYNNLFSHPIIKQ